MKGNKKKRKSNTFALLVIAALAVILGVQIIKVYGQIDTGRDELDELQQQETSLAEENQSLKEDLEKAGDEDFIKSLARKLGWYEDGTRLFVDPSR